MDEIAHALIQQEGEGEEGDLEQSAALAAVALMIIGVEELCAERRQPSCLSVCRPQLLPNSSKDTPWQVLYQSHLIAPSSPPWDLMWMPSHML